jgi:hypothetical protein
MNREDIIRLVRQAANEEMEIAVLSIAELEKYTALVEAAEREACAKVVESYGPTLANSEMLVDAIRAR